MSGEHRHAFHRPRPEGDQAAVAQAEAIAAAAIGRSVTEGVATKVDIQVMEERLAAKIEGAKIQILIWLMGVIIATAGAIIAVVKL